MVDRLIYNTDDIHAIGTIEHERYFDSYNKTKHDRTTNFNKGTLCNSVNAVVAWIILCCVKFGSYTIFENDDPFSSLVKQLFSGKLYKDCKKISIYQ